ncbi:mediator of RNA polymerase II transcription subunit 10b-like [Zingiber officinale]|uniref:mediator of RNA polymerase II transcription subunit 10b-like n=1 Tax=Zingiber officinale TaxID=94328 RepID=UPI001C4BEBD4|nr:mediator of RNA polymerase II transcription subunit 10b-like [Zingiber officinale]
MDPSPQNSSSAAGNGGLSTSASATPSPAPNPTSAVASAPVDEAKQNLNQVINSIDKTLGLLHQLYVTVSSFSVASQLPLLQRLNALVSELDAMQKMADKCDVQIPLEVVNLIDDGKNPDEFTKDVINSCVAKNQMTKGKTDAFKSLRKNLLEELDHAFPDEVDMYREIRSSAAESRRPAQSLQTLQNGDVKIKSEY